MIARGDKPQVILAIRRRKQKAVSALVHLASTCSFQLSFGSSMTMILNLSTTVKWLSKETDSFLFVRFVSPSKQNHFCFNRINRKTSFNTPSFNTMQKSLHYVANSTNRDTTDYNNAVVCICLSKHTLSAEPL